MSWGDYSMTAYAAILAVALVAVLAYTGIRAWQWLDLTLRGPKW